MLKFTKEDFIENKKKYYILILLVCLIISVGFGFWIVYSNQHSPGFHNASLFDSDHKIYITQEGKQAYGFKTINGENYYFDVHTGYMHTGFLEREDGTYYYNNDGKQLTGFIEIGDDMYYFDKDGKMVTSRFVDISDGDQSWKAYFQEDGTMATSTITIEGKTYSFNKEGKMLRDLSSLQQSIEESLASYGIPIGIYFKDLTTGTTIESGSTDIYPCSVIKIFVMATCYQEIEEGNLNKEDCQASLEAMIINSDNSAYNNLVTMIGQGDASNGAKIINDYVSSLGLANTYIRHGLQPADNYFMYEIGENTTTPKDVGTLLQMIYDKEIVSESACKEMIDLLLRCADTDGLVSAVPEGVQVAHKSGWASGYYLDGGIVYTDQGDYILVIFTETTDSSVCQNIASTIYSQYTTN